MLTFRQYTKAIDIWSVGCILAEVLSGGRPIFPGRDYHHQIGIILDVLGTPSIEEFTAISSRRSRDYIRWGIPTSFSPPRTSKLKVGWA